MNLEDLDKINNAYIYSKNTIITNNNFITPSAISLGNYAIENYKKLVKKYNEKIKPIYLSENKFVKIDDNKANSEHIDDILEIENSSYLRPWTKQSFMNEIDNEISSNWVYISSSKLIGYLFGWKIENEFYYKTI